MAPKTHFTHQRLFVNAGMKFPACEGNAELLNLDAGRWNISSDVYEVTCKKCKKIIFQYKSN
jgi:hypothetical protein